MIIGTVIEAMIPRHDIRVTKAEMPSGAEHTNSSDAMRPIAQKAITAATSRLAEVIEIEAERPAISFRLKMSRE